LSYRGIVSVLALTIGLLAMADVVLLVKWQRYESETQRLRADMTGVERKRTDLLLAADTNRLAMMVALVRRQAEGDQALHLAVSVDSGRMHLERDGAKLRDMRVQVGAERWVHGDGDSVYMAMPRGARTVERLLNAGDSWEVPAWAFRDRGLTPSGDRHVTGALGPAAIVLSGGTVIYAMPTTGPLNDSSYVLPGSVRASAADLKAILPNLAPGMKIYFY
jgi:hypothetical protein